MARTTTREIVFVCTELAKLDRRGKETVMEYLQGELNRSAEEKGLAAITRKKAAYLEEDGTLSRVETYTQGVER